MIALLQKGSYLTTMYPRGPGYCFSSPLLSPKGWTGKVSKFRISSHAVLLAMSPFVSVSTTLIVLQPCRSINSQMTFTPCGHCHFSRLFLTSGSPLGSHVQMSLKYIAAPPAPLFMKEGQRPLISHWHPIKKGRLCPLIIR